MNSLIEIQFTGRKVIKQDITAREGKAGAHNYKTRKRKRRQGTAVQSADVMPQLDDRCLCLFS